MASLLNVVEVAEQLKIRPSTVRSWTREGILPCIRITGRVVRYDLESVRAALVKRDAASRDDATRDRRARS